MTPEQILEELQKYPDSIFEVDMELANIGGQLAELKDSLELAELNAELGAVIPDGKSNEDTRKKIREEAIAKSPDVRRLKAHITTEKIKHAEHEAERAKYLRQFQAAMSMAELAAAQLNAVACKTRKETR